MAHGGCRRRTYNEPGHAHELTFSCYRKYPFLKAERTCRWLAEAIEVARGKLSFRLWSYVFMPDHVHLIVHPTCPSYDIAKILQAVKVPVGRKAIGHLAEHAPSWLARVTRKRGRRNDHLFWQPGGGYDRNIDRPEPLAAMIEYIHLNPVRRGLVERPEDWPWSSAGWWSDRASNGLDPDPIPPEWSEAIG